MERGVAVASCIMSALDILGTALTGEGAPCDRCGGDHTPCRLILGIRHPLKCTDARYHRLTDEVNKRACRLFHLILLTQLGNS